MTFGKAILVLCLSLLTVQAYSNVGVDVEIKSPISALKQLLKDLTEKVQGAVSTALSTLFGMVDQIEGAAGSFEATLNTVLVEACKPFIQQIESAVALAGKAGVKVSDCVGSSEDDILNLPGQLLINVTSCVTDKVDEAKQVIQKFVTDVNSSVNAVFKIADDVESCSHQSFIILPICAAECTATIAGSVVSIPLQITKDVADAKVYLATVIPSFALCDVGSKAALGLKAASIVKDVTTCISKKMSESSSTSPAAASTSPAASTGSSGSHPAPVVSSSPKSHVVY